jgi:chromosomal replication initiator protein
MSLETIASLCIDVACQYFNVTRADMLSRARPARLCWPRHVAMTVAWELTGLSTIRLATIFNRKDHVTVLHAHRVVVGVVDVRRKLEYQRVEALIRAKAQKAA